jgi:tRNA pseudouridine55 synthase
LTVHDAAPAGAEAARGPWAGLLLVDKPVGVTSHDVVERVRRRLRSPGAGHLGTLDPAASGLLVVAMGAATRCIPVWQGGDKTYEAVVRFGVTTSTQDLQGEVLAERAVTFDEAALRDATRAFTGEGTQVPPMVSALKVGGQRLYRLARRGEVVERAPRPIRVDAWEWLAVRLPEATCRIRCSGGTYVRTLAHDLGEALGSGAALGALRRVRSEPWSVDDAIAMRALDELPAAEAIARAGVPLDRALEALPAVTLDDDAVAAIGYGRRPAVTPGAAPIDGGPRSVVLRDRAGRALALGELTRDPSDPERVHACPHVVLPWAVREGLS